MLQLQLKVIETAYNCKTDIVNASKTLTLVKKIFRTNRQSIGEANKSLARLRAYQSWEATTMLKRPLFMKLITLLASKYQNLSNEILYDQFGQFCVTIKKSNATLCVSNKNSHDLTSNFTKQPQTAKRTMALRPKHSNYLK